ncbi:MAG: 4-hydroxythreonine-4-phosphate dehydrogenase PdxA, partial [Ignavibacteria bacterium]
DQLTLLIKSLSIDFGINHPEIALLGLNPHAGEKGKIGNEEKMLEDVISKFENVNGPFVPDAFFARKKYKEFDLTLGMYHDQILIPFKLLNPNAGVNFTAGLPIVRTSPDHGTAFDIAGQNKADPQSFIHAINWGIKILNNRTVGNGK